MNDLKAAAALPSTAEDVRFSYVPRPGLLKLTLVNLVLSILTLSIYRFWAKTNVRKHIWSCVHINGEPLEYTGTGMELFKGFLMVFLFILLPYVALATFISFSQGPESPLLAAMQMAFFLVVYVLWGFAVYKARKYQLSRTNWRGIRGTLVGNAMIYSLLYFGSMIARGMSLGWATPVMNTVLQEQIVNEMRFGTAAFKFKGRAGPLYPTYALCWFLTLAAIIAVIVLAVSTPSLQAFFSTLSSETSTPESIQKTIAYIVVGLGLLFLLFALLVPMLWAVYSAKEMRTFAAYTRFDGAPFRLDATAPSVIWLTVVNLLLIIFTLGIAWPFVQQRVVRYVVDRLSLDGKVDIDRIAQSTAAMPTRGEGLADAFDIGGL